MFKRSDNFQLRLIKEKTSRKLFQLIFLFTVLLFLSLMVLLYIKSVPLLQKIPLNELLLGTKWQPWKQKFGFFPFIIGTIWTSLLAIIIALPICLLAAVYLSEYSSEKIRSVYKTIFDILAGIPSVVYGLWGILVIVPAVRELALILKIPSTGYSMLSGALVLAVMVIPVIIQILLDIFSAFPQETRMAALSLGATRWQMVKKVLLKKSFSGISSVTILAIARVFGETMAVLMVAGNVARVPKTVFDPVYPLPALIANYYGEILSIPFFDSAILFAAFLLFLVVLIFNILANILIFSLKQR